MMDGLDDAWANPSEGAWSPRPAHASANCCAERSIPRGPVMRQVLVDYARAGSVKRGPAIQVELPENLASRVPSESLLELDQALERLGQEDPRRVMLVQMRFFAGMTADDTAESTRESVLRRGYDG